MELPNRVELEAKFGKRIQKLSNRHMAELLRLLGTPPNFGNVTPAFWQNVRRETENETAALLLLLFATSATTHASPPTSRVSGEFPTQGSDLGSLGGIIEQEAEAYARERATAVAARQAATAAARFEKFKERIEAKAETVRKADIVKESEPIFSPGQTIQIARDETTRARHQGGELGISLTVGKSEDDLWMNRPSMSRTGPCPICSPLDNQPRSVWSLKFPGGPPDPHVGCVCVIEYAFERATADA